MTKDEVLEIIRSGVVRVVVRYIEESGRVVMTISGAPGAATPEFLQACKENQGEVFFLIRGNSDQVCIAPDEHRSSYRDTPLIGVTCDRCAEIRQAEAAQLPQQFEIFEDWTEKP